MDGTVILFFTDDGYWVLGHQHLVHAVLQFRAERQKKGKGTLPWLEHIKCDVLKTTCPLDTRKFIAGQHNATARLVRTTNVAECMEMLLKDAPTSERERDLHNRIRRTLERCGMNVEVANAVCYVLCDASHSPFISLPRWVPFANGCHCQ